MSEEIVHIIVSLDYLIYIYTYLQNRINYRSWGLQKHWEHADVISIE
jgi:hypothetical protein